jgi:4-hydroxy 2-oxovalerate aldolase
LTQILDCTLRDGGYYTNWCFDADLVKKYLQAVEVAGVDYVELGLKTPDSKKDLGAFAYCDETFLSTLALSSKQSYGVMVNGKDYVYSTRGCEKEVKRNFVPQSESPLSFVRIAIHYKDLENTRELSELLKGLGYQVKLCLMQISERSTEELKNLCEKITEWDHFETLYMNDSLGALRPKDIEPLMTWLRLHWKGKLGLHAHDNLGCAFANSLEALDQNIELIDGTVRGMGRGAGNTKTEYLVDEVKNHNGNSLLYNLVIDEFAELHGRYQWGDSLAYFLSGKQGIHPSYIQELSLNQTLEPEKVVEVLQVLTEKSPLMYDKNLLSSLTQPNP